MSSMQASRVIRWLSFLHRDRSTSAEAKSLEDTWHQKFLHALRQISDGGAEGEGRKEVAELTLSYAKERYKDVWERYLKLDQRIEDLGKFVVGFYGAAVAILKLLSPTAMGKAPGELSSGLATGDEWTVMALLFGAAMGCLTLVIVLIGKRAVHIPTTTDARDLADYALKQGLVAGCRDASVVKFFLASSYAYVGAAMRPAIRRKAFYLNTAVLFGILTVLTSVGVLLLGLWPEVPATIRSWMAS